MQIWSRSTPDPDVICCMLFLLLQVWNMSCGGTNTGQLWLCITLFPAPPLPALCRGSHSPQRCQEEWGFLVKPPFLQDRAGGSWCFPASWVPALAMAASPGGVDAWCVLLTEFRSARSSQSSSGIWGHSQEKPSQEIDVKHP